MLLIDGAKYNLWIPDKEEQFEDMIKEHAKEIFGEDSLYFGIKQKIVSRTGIGSIPDGYLIKFKPLEWYLVEAELSSHSHEHVVMQLNRFMSGIRNFESQREITEAIYGEIAKVPSMRETIRLNSNFDDAHHFLSNLISQAPKIVIIVEQEDPDIQEACENLRVVPQTVVFKTYVKEGAESVHVHLFEPLYEFKRPKEIIKEEEKKYPPHWLSWEKRLEWVNDNTRDIVKVLTSRILELGEVNTKVIGRYYSFNRREPSSKSRFAVLMLSKKHVAVRIRAEPIAFKDPKKWTGDKVYIKWFFHHGRGQEREFRITDKGQIDYAMELIKQSYDLAK
jgi:predicted transport protein